MVTLDQKNETPVPVVGGGMIHDAKWKASGEMRWFKKKKAEDAELQQLMVSDRGESQWRTIRLEIED